MHSGIVVKQRHHASRLVQGVRKARNLRIGMLVSAREQGQLYLMSREREREGLVTSLKNM